MSQRIIRHILFWFSFVTLYVIRDMLFAGPSDLAYPFWHRVMRFFFSELSILPWKAIPFYVLFYFLIPRFFSQKQYAKTAGYFVFTLCICLIGYRSMVAPVSQLLYNETPAFNVYAFERFIYTVTDLLPALGLASTIKLLKGSIIFREKEAALQNEKRISELSFLKAQTNAHFLFNTLNNLYGLVRRNDPSAASSILKLSNIVRYILHECDGTTIPVANEIKVIRDYLALEKLRYDERLRIDFEIHLANDPDRLPLEIPPLILLPFVENAFKHGVSETRMDPFVAIHLQESNSRLHFQVTNSRDHEAETNEQGIGLKNVKRQLDLIYGDQYTLQVHPNDTVFSIDLLIHLNGKHG